MKYVFAATIILLGIQANAQYKFKGGTTIITLLTKDSIWMAADSKQSDLRHGRFTYNHRLKIIEVENVFFAIAGNATSIVSPQKDTVFNAYKTLSILV